MRNKNNQQFKWQNDQSLESGFTLIEMLVVIFIFATMSTIFIANYAGLRGPRDLKISQNELVTNIRKIQSYTLSSRNAPNGNPAKYYILKFSTNSPQSVPQTYTVQMVDNVGNFFSAVETLSFQGKIGFGSIAHPISVVDGNSNPVLPALGPNTPPVACLQVAFALPFGSIYIEAKDTNTCSLESQVTNQAYLSTIANRIATIRLMDPASGGQKSVIINGVTGAITIQ